MGSKARGSGRSDCGIVQFQLACLVLMAVLFAGGTLHAEVNQPPSIKHSVGMADSGNGTIFSQPSNQETHTFTKYELWFAAIALLLLTFLGVVSWNSRLRLKEQIASLNKAREKVAESEQHFRIIFDHVPYAIVISSLYEGVILDVNRTFVALQGFPKDELQKLKMSDISSYTEDDVVSLSDILVEKGHVHDLETKLIRSNGLELIVMFSSVTISFNGIPSALSIGMDVTEKKKIEQTLKSSEEKYRAIFENTPIGIFRTTFDGKVLDTNQAMAKMLGYASREEALVGINNLAKNTYNSPVDRQRFLDALFASPDGMRMETELKRKDGSVLYGVVNASLQLDSDNNPLFIDGTIEDIGFRKQAEEALKRSEAAYREIFNSVNDAIIIHDQETGRILDANSTMLEMFGYTREEMSKVRDLGLEDISSGEHPYTQERAQQLIQMAASGKSQVFDWRSRHRDGHYFWAEVSLRKAVIAGEGRILAIVRDITERKDAVESLRASEEKFSTLFQLSPDAIILVNFESETIIDINLAWCELFGFSREEVIGRRTVELGVYKFVKERKVLFQRLREGERVKNYEVQAQKKTGEIFICSLSCVVISVLEEPILFGIVRDITASRKMQEMMIQTEKMISVGGIAAGIAHEINNPLGIVLQAAQSVRQRTRPDFKKNLAVAEQIGLDMDLLQKYIRERELDEFIEDIQAAALRAAIIIRHMLDFSRHSESKRAQCDLIELVDKAVALASSDYDLKKSYDFRKIEIVRDYPPEGCLIKCTATEIEQVILNILRNAAQAMASQENPVENPRIIIRIEPFDGYIRITLEDNGPGVPEDVCSRIFEPFFTTKGPGVWTGLGLSVSYFIITKGHGGNISVGTSSEGGASFVIDLPEGTPLEE